MPIYEYECGRCRNRFEERRTFHDDSLATCPKCNNEAHRLFTPVPIIFKGSGFYTTDHRAPEPTESTTESSGGDTASDCAATKSD